MLLSLVSEQELETLLKLSETDRNRLLNRENDSAIESVSIHWLPDETTDR